MQPMQHLFAWSEPLPRARRGRSRDRAADPAPSGSRHVRPPARRRLSASAPTSMRRITIEPERSRAHPDGHQIAHGAVLRRPLGGVAGVGQGAPAGARRRGHRRHLQRPLLVRRRQQLVRRARRPRVPGLWLADGIWVTHGGGTAKAVADLMTTGRCALDLGPMHPDRLLRVPAQPALRRERGKTAVRRGLRHHPPAARCSRIRAGSHDAVAPALPRHGAELTESAGWERAQWFAPTTPCRCRESCPTARRGPHRHWSPTIGREHPATRTGVGVFDLTPFVKVEAEGPGVAEWLNRVCASEIDRPVGRILYTTVLDHDGGCVCDLTVTRLERRSLPARHRRRLRPA